MATEEIDVRLRLKDDLSKPLKRTEEEIKRTSEETDQLGKSTDQMSEKQQRAAIRAQRLENAQKRTELQTARLAQQTEKAAAATERAAKKEEERIKQLRYAGTWLGKLDNKTKSARMGLATFGREVGKTITGLISLGRVFMVLKVAAFVSGINLAITAVGGLAGAAVAAVGALAPMIGILGGIPAMAVGASLAMGVMKTAFSGISGAVKALSDPSSTIKDINKATKGLSPAAKAFAVQVANIKDAWVPVRDAVQQATLPLLGGAMQKFVYTYLPFMQKQLSALGHLFGVMATKAADMTTTSGWQKDFNTLANQNRILTQKWMNVFLNLLPVIRDIAVAAAPMMQMFANWMLKVSQRTADWFSQARKSGRLTAFFNEAYRTVKGVAGVAWDFAVALKNIFSIGASSGRSMGKSLADITKQFRAWTASDKGRKQIGDWFHKMEPITRQIGKLVRDIVKDLFGLTETPGAAKLIKQLRTQLLPVLDKLLKVIGLQMGKGLIDLAANLGNLATTVAQGGLLNNINAIVGVLNKLVGWFNKAPAPVQHFVASFVAFAAIMKVSGIPKLIGNMYSLYKAFKETAIGARVLAAAGRASSGAMAALTSPVGLIVIALAALVIGFIYAYKHSETFRKIVNGALHGVADAATWLWDKVLRPTFKFIIDAWLNLAGGIVNGAADAFGWVPGLGGKLKDAAKSFNTFRDNVNNALDGIDPVKDVTVKLKVSDKQLATIPGIDKPRVTMRFAGGPVAAGNPYLVGELGPELLKSASGALSWLGLHGPELINPTQSGTVIPNHEVAQHVPVVQPRTSRDRNTDTRSAGPIPPINVNLWGDASGLTKEDVEQAAMRAYRRFERERKERH